MFGPMKDRGLDRSSAEVPVYGWTAGGNGVLGTEG